jgi:hypothetical protein
VRYSSADLHARLEALLDSGPRSELSPSANACAVRVMRGELAAHSVLCAGTDGSRSRGAIGVAEADQLCTAFTEARVTNTPLLLLLDSGGAKVNQGLAALGAFRRLYRSALHTRLAGVPMFALLGRSCFGGASMLATLCERRVYCDQTLLAASGPAVVEALAGRDQLRANDPDAVRALMGGESRTRLGQDEILCLDDMESFRVQARSLVSSLGPSRLNIRAQHKLLGQRLAGLQDSSASTANHHAMARLKALVPAGYRCDARGEMVFATGARPEQQPTFLGVLSGGTIGAATLWLLADGLIKLHDQHPATPVILVLDATGQSAGRQDEELMLSQYISHFALSAAWLGEEHHRMLLWIPGQAAGAIYVAFAAPVQTVSALPTAQLRILPDAAASLIVRQAPAPTSDPDEWIAAGVVDALLDSRLASYASS